jgi:tetratricopeptide (TPR) repeat protein
LRNRIGVSTIAAFDQPADRSVRHRWLVASSRADQARILAEAGHDRTILIDAHRNRRGPYSAAGALALALVERLGAAARAAAADRLVTLLAVRPELRNLVPVPPEVERSLTFSREGNRRSWSLRSAHALVDFVLACLEGTGGRSWRIGFFGVDQAGPLDAEFLELLLRRVPADRLAIAIASASENVPGPLQSALGSLGPTVIAAEDLAPAARASAADYVESDCTLDEPAALAAYAALSEPERAALHRRRAELLQALGEASLALGAIPLHVERAGGDPAILAAASRQCLHFAYYEAALDWARRAVRLAEAQGNKNVRNDAARDMIFATLLLDRFDEAEALSERTLAESNDPALRGHAYYALAILYARLHDRARHDYERAKRCIERALASFSLLPASGGRASNIAFLRNTLALVALREGEPEAALRLLTDAIDYLAGEAPETFATQAMILLHNRARLHTLARRETAALEDLGRLLELEPTSPEALFDRALIHHKAGRVADALRDYDASLLWGPPLIEALLNRAQLLAKTGDRAGARRDYDHLYSIDPGHLEIIVGRTTWLWEEGQLAAADAETERGLRLHPDNARLLCLRGLVALVRNRLQDAEAAFTAALAVDPGLADAWANRAIVRWRRDEADAALSDLDQALALRDDATIRRNREKVLAQLYGHSPIAAARMLQQA